MVAWRALQTMVPHLRDMTLTLFRLHSKTSKAAGPPSLAQNQCARLAPLASLSVWLALGWFIS